MRSVKYKVLPLKEPKGSITHQVVYETMSKNFERGGFGKGIKFMGSYRQCVRRRKELEKENKNEL